MARLRPLHAEGRHEPLAERAVDGRVRRQQRREEPAEHQHGHDCEPHGRGASDGRARDLMDREYANPLDVPAMANAALMSPSHFSRQFRAAYGETPSRTAR